MVRAMRSTLLILSVTFTFMGSALAETYSHVPGWLKLPSGREHIGNLHGEVDVDSKGMIYISVEGEHGALQVFNPDGTFSHAVPSMPKSLHGFVIKDDFIYASVLSEGKVIKTTLDGETVLEIPSSAFPEENFGPKGLRLTSVDVAPNGDIYVVDGYGLDWIYVFDSEGNLKNTFGGRVAPYHLQNCHKIFIDHRYDEPRILACDRENLRLLHLDLDGKIIGEYATDLRKPSSASFHGDLVVIAEIAGRVLVLDKKGKTVAEIGTNSEPTEISTAKTVPEQWRKGIVTSPHGIAFDNQGNIIVTEWNKVGRVLRWNVQR
tara:strand:+ start:501 stop:1457 length:957 start_codon:yes stop_codon:yes gene_type:complete